jgi:phosphoglycolate phosphatase
MVILFFCSTKMKKPNPRLLADICSREGFKPSDAIYDGDSLLKIYLWLMMLFCYEYGRQRDPKY